MDKTEVRPLYRCCCCSYSGSRDSEPLFLAVYKNDLEGLKSIISSGKSVNGKSVGGNTLLNYVIEQSRVEIFDYLLTLDETDIDSVDNSGRSPIMCATSMAADGYFARRLAEKGADVLMKDHKGMTLLHLAARNPISESLTVAKNVIDEGGRIDELNNEEESPLYIACIEGNVNCIYLYLYYGADPSLASKGILPVAAVPSLFLPEVKAQVEDFLFEHTFDQYERVVPLPTMVNFMANDHLFERIMDPAPEVVYDDSDLKYLFDHLLELNLKNLQVFIGKFGYIIKDFLDDFPLLSILVKLYPSLNATYIRDFLDVFLYSDYVFEFVQTADPDANTIGRLASVCSKEETTRITCIMLSYGLNVTSNDLDVVYSRFGHCELFNILLHMDIKMVAGRNVMAAIFYDLEVEPEKHPFDVNLLRFFNRFKLKERCMNEVDEEHLVKMQFLPTVPRLLELSRDQARKYIISRYDVKNSREFYTVSKWLPIPEVYKRIITYEKSLNFI